MAWVNHILFFAISLAGVYFLFADKTYLLKDAFVKTQRFAVTNRQYLLLFIFSTAILACGNYMADRMMVTIVLLLLAIVTGKQKIGFSPAVLFYVLYLIWIIFSILFITPVKDYGFRVFLKYLYPFLIMLFASQLPVTVQYCFKALKVVIYVALFAVLWLLLITRIPFINHFFGSFVFWGPGIIDFLPIALAITLVFYSYLGEKKYLLYAALFVLPSLLTAIRTGILASAITIVVFAIIRYKTKSLPYVLLGSALLIGSVLYMPHVREKMFKKQMSTEEIVERRDELTADDIDSSGRFAMWEWSLEQFYKGKEWSGSGVGQLQAAFYTWDHPFGRLKVVHNDYIQILCDTGLIGLILYGLTMLSLIVHAFWVYFRSDNGLVKTIALVAGLTMAGMLSTLYTDNVVNYSMMTLSFPFALYGLFLALMKKKDSLV